MARAAGASDPRVDDVALAVTEACANAVVHAYTRDEAPGQVAVSATAGGSRLTVVVRDWGVGLDRASLTPGLGLGLPLLHALSDGVELVACADRGVEVRLTFHIDQHH